MQRSHPSRQSLTSYHESTGQSFSMERGKSRPTPFRGAISTVVPCGAEMPALPAMKSADLPTTAGLGRRCGVTSTVASDSISASFKK
jgi:hypothetical protein